MNEKYPMALPEGSVLAGQYVIEKVLGQGGFGITYQAKDHKSGNRVAVKEFFPESMAHREGSHSVMSYSGEQQENFEYGKECFLQEAETLAQFIGNENIVRIHTYFEENGTAYFVMDFVDGTSFDEYLKERGGKISFDEAAKILIPVMDALAIVHGRGIVHRDVTPDNIYITKDGTVKLLDFGAARYSLGDKSRSLDVILKHGFAPKEQYARHGKQGPFTDVYALGATFYFALTGKRPPDSVERMDVDEIVLPSVLGVSISREAEEAIMMALNVRAEDRFQTMTAFKNAMMDLNAGAAPVVQRIFTAPAEKTAVTDAVGKSSVITPSQQIYKSAAMAGAGTDAGTNVGADITAAPVKKPKRKQTVIIAVAAAVLLIVTAVLIFGKKNVTGEYVAEINVDKALRATAEDKEDKELLFKYFYTDLIYICELNLEKAGDGELYIDYDAFIDSYNKNIRENTRAYWEEYAKLHDNVSDLDEFMASYEGGADGWVEDQINQSLLEKSNLNIENKKYDLEYEVDHDIIYLEIEMDGKEIEIKGTIEKNGTINLKLPEEITFTGESERAQFSKQR
ncbi:MAG: serine/threonine protein kinase [Lachnospiraceae bacterium]|nr:serine/threonine protein kinase [Lachnospiraceae bacterium]